MAISKEQLDRILGNQSILDRVLSSNQPTMKAYTPSTFDVINSSVQQKLEQAGLDRYKARDFTEKFLGSNNKIGLADFTPYGIAKGSEYAVNQFFAPAVQDFQQGNIASGLGGAGLGAGAMILGTGKIPTPIKTAAAGATKFVTEMAERVVGSAPKLDRQLRKISEAKLLEKKIAGAPLGVVTAADEAARRKNYLNQVVEGMAGRNWYDDSGQKINFLTGENKNLANQVAETFGITSQSTGVPANTAFAIKGHNQAMAGMPINTGRFPATQSSNIADVYSANQGMATGLKRSPFADQIAIGGGFYQKPVGQGHRAVHDIWDGEAFGYVNPDGTPLRRGFSPAEHDWMDEQTQKMITSANKNKLGGAENWTPGRIQAASWSGAKIRAGDINPDQAAYSYADAIPLNYAQQSREAVTGKTTGQNVGLLNAPLDVRQAYDDAVTKAFYDQQGRDEISKAYGLLTDKSFYSLGVFEGNVNPGRQSLVAVGRETGSPLIDEASRQLLNATESNYGLLTAQDAAAWSQLAPNKVSAKSADRVGINLKNTIDDNAMTSLNDFNNSLAKKYKLDDAPFALVPSPTGVNIINFALPNDAFQKEVKAISNNLGATKNDIRYALGSNEYIPQDWQNQGLLGKSNYVKNIENIEQSRKGAGLYSAFDKVSPGLAAKINDIDKQFGFELSPYIMTLRQAIADNGIAGLREIIKKGALPAVLVAEITPFLNDQPMD